MRIARDSVAAHAAGNAAVPKISVLMAVYNGARFLEASVRSILDQTLDDFEFIIVDDASTDATTLMLHRFAAHDPRIRILTNGANLGLTRSLNLGLVAARGEVVARMDTDDMALPERFARQYAYLEQHPMVFLVGSSCELIDDAGVRTGLLSVPETPLEVARVLPERNCIQHPTIMFRNHAEVHYREKFRYAQDYDLYLCLLSSGRPLGNLGEPLLRYRVTPETISFAKRAQQYLFAEKAREFHRQRLDRGNDDYDSWDPAAILGFDPAATTDPAILIMEMHAAFGARRFAEVRRILRRYFAVHGWRSRYLAHWCWSSVRQYALPGFSITFALRRFWPHRR